MTSNTDDIYKQFLKLIEDPGFSDRKKLLDEIRADVNVLVSTADAAKAAAEVRIKAAERVETANNFVKMALDKRANEIEASINRLKMDDMNLTARVAAEHANLVEATKQQEQYLASLKADLERSQAELNDRITQLTADEHAFAAEVDVFKNDKAAFEKVMADRTAAADNREQDLTAKETAFNKKQADADAETARLQSHLATQIEIHSDKVTALKDKIKQLNTTLD